jgi:predicted PurR-regulated permease PerM
MRDESLASRFAGPDWLRDLGIVSWMIVGIVLVLVGAIWLLALTSVIVMPVLVAFIIACVTVPLVGWLGRHRLPRAAASGLVLLAFLVAAIGLGGIVLGGITSQGDAITSKLHDATNQISQWAKDAGIATGTADSAKSTAESSTSDAVHALLTGVVHILSSLASLAVFLSFTAITLFFLLKDGPSLREWVERHAGVPFDVAHTVTEEVMRAMRGYFAGVTIVAAFTAVIVGAAALIIGVPLAGTIALVTFLGGYIPYIGAWAAGVFSVLIALGGQGESAAIAMAIVSLLGNGILQQLVQPFAYGAALDLHPIAVLILTIAAGCLFGTIGLVLAAPITSAVVRIIHDLREATAAAAVTPGPPPLAASAPR